jgi:hypothetical protein
MSKVMMPPAFFITENGFKFNEPFCAKLRMATFIIKCRIRALLDGDYGEYNIHQLEFILGLSAIQFCDWYRYKSDLFRQPCCSVLAGFRRKALAYAGALYVDAVCKLLCEDIRTLIKTFICK